MSFRFFQRIRIAPGLTLNLSKRGASVSVGPQGAKFTVGTSGTRATAGLPGTGLFYTVANPHRPRRQTRGTTSVAPVNPVTAARSKLSMGFFKRLVTPAHERAFVDGLSALNEGREAEALQKVEEVLQASPGVADAAWVAGLLRLKQEHLDQAIGHFRTALAAPAGIGLLFTEYGLAPQLKLPVTPEVVATAVPGADSAQLALVEALQLAGRPREAMAVLEEMLTSRPTDAVVLASLAELVLDGSDAAGAQRVVELTVAVANETPVHTAVLLYRGKALARLGMDQAAVKVWTDALRRTKDRSPELLREIRFQRADAYERLGRKAQARGEWERIYAEAPGYRDVGRRLGLGNG